MNHTIPESPETIEAQLEWLRAGKRKAVLLTPGCVLPEWPPGCNAIMCAQGLLIHSLHIDPSWFRAKLQAGKLGEILGYGLPDKPVAAVCDRPPHARQSQTAATPQVVVVRGPNGHEKQAVVTDSARLDAATAAAHAVKDEADTVSLEDAGRVLGDRLKSLDARELKVRPYRPEQDEQALAAAARADQHCPLNPTHVIERHGQIVGYFGCSSLPLYRLWFHSQELKAADSLRLLFMIENHYRMAGVETLGTIIHTGSPFYPVATRGGYLESGGDRLFLKDL